jgi:ProP effector
MAISRTDIDAAIELLCERFPRAFFQFERKRLPLKIGIRDDITAVICDAIDRQLLGMALRYYTDNFGYRRAQKEGAPRIDLNGEPAGTVSEADALDAASDVASRKAALKARKRSQATPAAPVLETSAPSPAPPPPRKDGLATSLSSVIVAATYAFDILAEGGEDLRKLPLSMRKTNPARL